MKHIKILLIVLLSLFLVRPASALPASCYQYTAYDGFDSPDQWSPWNASQSGMILTGPAPGYGALSGNTADVFTFPWFEPSGSFLITDKVFDSTSSIDHNLTTRFPSRGCPHAIPFNPSGPLLYCSDSIWIKPLGGANGSFQLLATDYSYLESRSFNLPASTNWTEITIVNSLRCQNTMIVRVGISRTSSSAQMVADDVNITWAY